MLSPCLCYDSALDSLSCKTSGAFRVCPGRMTFCSVHRQPVQSVSRPGWQLHCMPSAPLHTVLQPWPYLYCVEVWVAPSSPFLVVSVAHSPTVSDSWAGGSLNYDSQSPGHTHSRILAWWRAGVVESLSGHQLRTFYRQELHSCAVPYQTPH